MTKYRFTFCSVCDPDHRKGIRFSEERRDLRCKCCGQSLKPDPVWWIEYYVSGRRKREKIGPSRVLADQVLAKRRVEIAEGKFLDKKKEHKTTFPELCETYLRLHSRVVKRSWKTDEIRAEMLRAFFGNRSLQSITSFLVEQYKEKRSKSKSQRKDFFAVATINREMALLKHMFTKAIEWGYADENPVKKIKLYKENNARVRYLEKEEIKKLIENACDHLKPILIVAFNTGMRKGEILRLKWTDLDFRNNMIHIRQSKSGEPRAVPMSETVRRTFIAVRKHPVSPFVFCDDEGKTYRDVRKSFFTACKKSDIKDFRFHDARHTYASHLVMKGEGLYTVQKLLGHKKPDMTLRYSHLSSDHLHRAVAKLDDLMDTQVDTKVFLEKSENLEFSQLIDNLAFIDSRPDSSVGRAMD